MARENMKDRKALANDLSQGGEEMLPAEFWKPKDAGDTIFGKLNRTEVRRSDYGDGKQTVGYFGPVLVRRAGKTEGFAEMAVNLDVTVLNPLKAPANVGGIFSIQFLGEEKSNKSANNYKDFLLARHTVIRFQELLEKHAPEIAANDLPF